MPRSVLAAVVAAALVPAGADAHGVRHEVRLQDGTASVRVLYHGARALAGARYEVFAPGEPDRAREQGETDRHGWLVFVADAAGAWRVRVVDASGHGKVIEVEVPEAALAPLSTGSARREGEGEGGIAGVDPGRRETSIAIRGEHGGPRTGTAREEAETPGGEDPGLLRSLGGAAAIAFAFAAVFAVQRRRRAAER